MNRLIRVSILFSLLQLCLQVRAAANEPEWLGPYLKSKFIRCEMTEDQLREQVATHIDFNVRNLSAELKARGSEIESILQNRDEVEIGIFPKTPVFDFYVLEKVTVVIQKLNFQVQTTYYSDYSASPTVEKGLWFPLMVNDPGPGKPCTLGRIGFKEEARKFIPLVDLVIGDPPRVVASNIVQVMDPVEAPQTPAPNAKREAKPETKPEAKPEVKPEAKPEAKPEMKPEAKAPPPNAPIQKATKPSVDKNKEDNESEKPVAREGRRHRRHHEERNSDRHSRKRYHSHRRHRRNEDSQGQAPAEAAGPPAKPSECTGDASIWKTAGCKLGIVK
ncbi:MAG: hypothetical protein ACXVA9_01935 [Bdellovibrionales bacterium]